jgi:DNA repair exonuclease SbcCD ATPase subunit
MDSHTKQLVEMESELKALREEVSRQRSAHHQHSHYEEELKQLESRVESAQLEADFYKKLVKEAYGRFKQLSTTSANSAVPTASQQNQVKKIVDEWLSMFEAVREREMIYGSI